MQHKGLISTQVCSCQTRSVAQKIDFLAPQPLVYANIHQLNFAAAEQEENLI